MPVLPAQAFVATLPARAVPDLAGDGRHGRAARAALDAGVNGCVPVGTALLAVLGALPVGAVAGALMLRILDRPVRRVPTRKVGRHRC